MLHFKDFKTKKALDWYVTNNLTLDHRSVFLFRWLLGLVILFSLSVRLSEFGLLYSDMGFGGVEIITKQFSFHVVSSHYFYQGLLFLVGYALTLGFMSGWFTGFFSLSLFLFIVSMNNHIPIVINAGDTLLSILLFISFLLPSSAYRIHFRKPFIRQSEDLHQPKFHLSHMVLLVQVFCIYYS